VSGGINVPSFLTNGESRAAIATDGTNANATAFGGTTGILDAGLVGAFAAGDLATRMGVRNITSATGDVVFQVQTTDPAITTPAEGAPYNTAPGNPAFTPRTLQPKRYSAHVQVTEQLLAQSSQDMGAFVASEIRKAIDAKFSADVAAKLHTAADSSAAGGTMSAYDSDAATIYNAMDLEEFLLGKDVDLANVRVAASAEAYRKERNNSIDAGSGLIHATSPAVRQTVLGYQATVSSAVTQGELFMADVTQLVQCTWGGVNLIIDPYTDADQGVVRIIANMYKDFSGLNYNGICGYTAEVA
jgi:HK97 family phage major capsid protein